MQSTKPRSQDLRWQRTERHLMEALKEELDEKPLEKVKVTDLARRAEISKATFYLHYQDIYDLADAFVDARINEILEQLGDVEAALSDKEEFVHRFVEAFTSKDQYHFISIAGKNHLAPRFMDRFWRALGAILDEHAPMPVMPKARIALSFVVTGLIGTIQSNCNAGPNEDSFPKEELTPVLTDLFTAAMGILPPPPKASSSK